MTFYIGDCSGDFVKAAEVKHVYHIRDVGHLKDGDIVNIFGHVLRWDTDLCVSDNICRR